MSEMNMCAPFELNGISEETKAKKKTISTDAIMSTERRVITE